MASSLESADAKNKLEDLSGLTIAPGQNPYQALIDACNDDEAQIQTLYSVHRTTRNEQQKQKLLSVDFKELIIDQYLLRLENQRPGAPFVDPRNCLVYWARPPNHVVELAVRLQNKLKQIAPNLWLMPPHRLHMTALEVNHSRTPDEALATVEHMRPHMRAITDYTYTHRARLVKPMLSYDLAAIAVSFLPAASEPVTSAAPVPPQPDDRASRNEKFTYHHLRRDVFEAVKAAGVEVDSRYVVPSAHITLGRFLTQEDHATPAAREAWVRKIEEINGWLEKEVWDVEGGEFLGEWIVGQERGLDARTGPLWYGGGRTVMSGEGF